MMKRKLLVAALTAVVIAGGFAYWILRPARAPKEIVVYGNVDLRQVDLPFNGTERIAAVLAQEGDGVHQGQVLARLDTSRLAPQVAQAQAQLAAQQAVVDRLHHGSRPEEVAQARAALDSAKADAENARRQATRFRNLIAASGGRAASQQDLDNANAQLDVANAKVVSQQKALDLAVVGPRKEDVAQAEAQLQAQAAQLALLKQQLADANLVAPVDAVIRSRLMEAGEMASPQKPVFTLAITDPKWVRAYVSETDLGKIRSGEIAGIAIDSFPNRRFDGWVGFISPVAEFTPKTVQTEELRTSLVYEIRVFVKDPNDQLRLGMPATVYLPLTAGAAPGGKSAS
ncbi:MAG TPA: efflux RND transporter periplasmic adaptor subunit [Stellaceae bacterium]|jgi:HlyD family secretion protein|nr:efflux RND transporter periplasmic adaptor subunit [Stellaceae bacterium]